MASGHSSGLSARAEEAAHAIVQLLVRELSSPSTSSAPPQSTPVRAAESPVPPSPATSDSRVKQAMKRQFPGMFGTSQPRGKKRFCTPSPQTVKKTDFNIYVLPEPTQLSPKGSQELELAHAGLGKKMITLAENFKHDEIVAVLEEEFPKLRTLKGGWMFFKSTGGSGRRSLSVIPTDSEGYSTRLLRAATNNGKNVVYIIPLQEQLCTLPLPYDCAEFSKMPQSQCMTCGSKMPLQLLPLHVEGCYGTTTTDSVTCERDGSDMEQTDPTPTKIPNSLEVCPICQECFPTDVLPAHASTCCDGMTVADHSEAARGEELPGPSVPHLPTPVSAAWVNEVDPRKACELFREELLDLNAERRHLFLSVDTFDAEEQDSSFISFYKQHNVHWAAPLKCKLRGDAAVGEGVKRHVLSMAMQKLKTGFSTNLGSAALTSIFEGEKEHLVPSAAALLRESNLFEMAGRMMGHSFLHSGIGLSGLSLPVVTLLTGGSTDTAAAALTLQDCPDLDHREAIGFLKKAELTAAETTCLTDLCLSWDLPVPTSTNHDWLFQELLTHAVLRRVKQPIKQIRKGLKETGIWPLLSERPDVHPIFFPREANEELSSQIVIQHIIWPQPSCDSDEDEDDPVPLEKVSLITGFLRKFIEEASPEVLRDLMKFWVGWEQLTERLVVEVVTSTYPVALTCFLKLKLPSHYQTYTMFHRDLMMALSSISSGFGLV